MIANCKGREAVVEALTRETKTQKPPFPFDLTTLQRDAYNNFGYSPKQTLDIAQSLYEAALISYPRTSSQKLDPKLGFKTILRQLSQQKGYKELCKKLLEKGALRPNNGPKTDPAHPAIYPSGNKPEKLNNYQRKVYDLIVRRFLSVFAEPAVRETMKITLDVNGEMFHASGTRTLEPGWIEYYGPYARFKEQTLPEVNKGDKAEVKRLDMLDKETQPPNRYTQASILKEMEKLDLGTKGTRALILQTLYDRDYIRERAIEVTTLGEVVVKELREHSPEIVSTELTKTLERDMMAIQEQKKKRSEVIEKARKFLEKNLAAFKKNEKKIGKSLLKAVRKVMKEESTIGPCKCGGELMIRMSRAKKRFVGCTNYPKCTETFSLPQHGYLTIISEKCKKCGLNIVSVRSAGKRPWKLCVRCGYVNVRKPNGKKKEKTAAVKK